MPKKDVSQYSLFPEKMYEYHILLSPADAVKEAVDAMKQTLHEMIGIAARDRSSIAHISLLKFEAFESVNVKEMVKRAVAGERRFTTTINGYNNFVNGSERTLYLAIENPEPIDRLALLLKPGRKAALKKRERQTSILDKPVRKTPTILPHITIARNISESDFESIEDFEPFNYTAEWLCDRITLLKRPAGSDRYFSPAGEVKLL